MNSKEKEAVRAILPGHALACVQGWESSPDDPNKRYMCWWQRNGESVITRETCQCGEAVKKVRDMLGDWSKEGKVDQFNPGPGEVLTGFNFPSEDMRKQTTGISPNHNE